MTERRILHAYFHIQPGSRPDMYEQLLALAENLTPRVQAIPPDAAHLDITGALRYFDRDPEGIAALLRMRTLALHGVQTTCAIAPTRMLATMAAAVTPPGATTIIEAADVQAWLRPRPVAALHGVGPATATKLRAYGLHTIGDLADASLPALTRIFGAATGRSLHAHAHGHDLRTVQPQPIAKSVSAERAFGHDVLDPVEHRRALLDLAEELGGLLRDEQQIASTLALTFRYADRSTSSRSRTLPEPTGHTRPLVGAAYELYDLLGLQRARVRSISLRAQELRPAAEGAEQLSLDPTADRALAIETVTDRARARYGPGTLRPATLARAGPRHDSPS
ncbi:helix-hairpin-helix domain-containing protein (plasmid) [Streptomyces sp. DSM 116496]|uniref:DNA polymerase Y family protein n=1 Tax=Streptomyces stoeckheimensis TaxID=3344656 RepID=UPI0038B242D3